MRNLVLNLTVLLMFVVFMGPPNIVRASTATEITNNSASYESFGDDLIPWPWGSECPFPWREIGGRYMVRPVDGGQYSGHIIDFTVIPTEQVGVSYLRVVQYDRLGREYASGTGYALKDKRLVKGLLQSNDGERKYSVIVRSYAKKQKALCTDEDLATVITFCPLRGRKCMEDSNYELIKLKPGRKKH